MRVDALVRSPSVHLLAMDRHGWGSPVASCCRDSTWLPKKSCHFRSALFSVQPQRFFITVMLDRGILFCYRVA